MRERHLTRRPVRRHPDLSAWYTPAILGDTITSTLDLAKLSFYDLCKFTLELLLLRLLVHKSALMSERQSPPPPNPQQACSVKCWQRTSLRSYQSKPRTESTPTLNSLPLIQVYLYFS